MKLKFLYASIIAIFVLLITSTAFAATGTVGLKTDINKVKAGETFTVTLYATSEDGINGIDTKFTYDSEKLELISAELADSSNWSNLGANPDITVICNSTESIKNADIYVLKFKVKENATERDILKVETTAISLDTDARTDSEVAVEAKEAEVEVIADTTDNPADSTDENPEDNPADPTDENPEDNPADPTNDKPEQKPAEPTNDKPEQKSVESINVKQEDSTVASGKIPQTGKNILIILVLIVTGTVLAIILGKKYMEHKI